MKSIVTTVLLGTAAFFRAQTVIGFENFNLLPNSSYTSSASAPFTVSGLTFNHDHAFNTWVGGFAYTNQYDSTDGTFTNLHGVKAFKGRSQSATYAMMQTRGVIAVSGGTVSGMYVTNSTYAYKTILNGNQFSRKFGDTTGTGSGTAIAQGQYPDYFKLIAHAYKSGVKKTDSVTFYLADYRGASKKIVDTWEFVDMSPLGEADSIVFTFRSTDNGQFGMNTPAFAAIDDIGVKEIASGISKNIRINSIHVWPSPFSNEIKISGPPVKVRLFNASAILVASSETNQITGLEDLPGGIYYLTIAGSESKPLKLIKQ